MGLFTVCEQAAQVVERAPRAVSLGPGDQGKGPRGAMAGRSGLRPTSQVVALSSPIAHRTRKRKLIDKGFLLLLLVWFGLVLLV